MLPGADLTEEITQPLPEMDVSGSELTQLLQAWRGGDRSALDRLLPEVYALLRRMASSRIGSNDRTPTLEPTALVHEALLRLMGQGADWQNRSHFWRLRRCRCARCWSTMRDQEWLQNAVVARPC